MKLWYKVLIPDDAVDLPLGTYKACQNGQVVRLYILGSRQFRGLEHSLLGHYRDAHGTLIGVFACMY